MSENIETVSQKEEVIHILKEPRDWQDASESKPEPGMSVVIRFTNPNTVCWEDETKIYHLEDSMVGQWKDDHWEINPPFHKYNYSPLTTHNLMKDDTVVTHWAVCESGEIEGWKSRLDYFNTYKNLYITVDPDKEEAVYRALMWGASFIEDAFNRIEDPKVENQLSEYFQILKDLQYSIDNGGIHESTESDSESE